MSLLKFQKALPCQKNSKNLQRLNGPYLVHVTYPIFLMGSNILTNEVTSLLLLICIESVSRKPL